jgi:hypothetical protein
LASRGAPDRGPTSRACIGLAVHRPLGGKMKIDSSLAAVVTGGASGLGL